MTDKEKRRAELIAELEKTSVVGSFTKVGQLIREIEEIDNIEWDHEKGRYVSRALNIVELPSNVIAMQEEEIDWGCYYCYIHGGYHYPNCPNEIK